jgi:hypothetical protein
MDGAVVEDKPDRLGSAAGLWTVAAVDLLKKRDEISAAFAVTGVHDQVSLRPVKGTDQSDFGGLTRGRHAQVGPLFGPDMGEIGMRERFRLVPEQQHDVAGFGLRFQQLTAQAGAIDGIGVLTPLQRVPRAAPAKAPFFRSTTDNREGEIRTPERS